MIFFSILPICLWFLPDVLMLISSVTLHLVLKKVAISRREDEETADVRNLIQTFSLEEGLSPENYMLLKRAG